MNILLTGAAGFIGSNILEELSHDKDIEHIYAIDNLSNSTTKNINHLISNSKITFIEGNILDTKLIDSLMSKIDVICHQAANISVVGSFQEPNKYLMNNVVGFSDLIQSAISSGRVKKVIYASSSSVYGDVESIKKQENQLGEPVSLYALTKRFDEMLAKNYSSISSIDFYGLRYFNVFGKNQRLGSEYSAVIPKFIDSIYHNKNIDIYGDGEQVRDFTHINNIVDVNILLIKNALKGNHIINVGTGVGTSINTLCSLIQQKMKKKITPIYCPKRTGETIHSVADISKLKNMLGYESRVSLEDGLVLTIDWFLKYL